MIKTQINNMIDLANRLQNAIKQDIEDVRKANHEKLLDRNDEKLDLMMRIASEQKVLNQLLSDEISRGSDIDIFRDDVDLLESSLVELYKLNGKLAAIVLPVKEMYRQIIEDITRHNGGSLFEVNA